MIDLGRETDGNNGICLGVRFAFRITDPSQKFILPDWLVHQCSDN